MAATAGKRRRRGFTLIELLVTLAVVIIIVTIAVPNFFSLIKSNRISVVSNNALSSLMFARNEALARKSSTRVALGSEQGWPLDVIEDGEVISSRRVNAEGFALAWSSGSGVVFNSMGHADAETSLCIARDGDLEREVRIYKSGQIRAYVAPDFVNCP